MEFSRLPGRGAFYGRVFFSNSPNTSRYKHTRRWRIYNFRHDRQTFVHRIPLLCLPRAIIAITEITFSPVYSRAVLSYRRGRKKKNYYSCPSPNNSTMCEISPNHNCRNSYQTNPIGSYMK